MKDGYDYDIQDFTWLGWNIFYDLFSYHMHHTVTRSSSYKLYKNFATLTAENTSFLNGSLTIGIAFLKKSENVAMVFQIYKLDLH